MTDASGQYTIYWVPAGNVKLYFNAGLTGYSSEWYNDKADFATADLLALTAGQNVTGINAQLRPGHHRRHLAQRRRSWVGATGHDIAWTSTGAIASVNIDYSTDGGTNWTAIAAGTENDGSYNWILPDVVSATCLVRVGDTADSNPTGQSIDVRHPGCRHRVHHRHPAQRRREPYPGLDAGHRLDIDRFDNQRRHRLFHRQRRQLGIDSLHGTSNDGQLRRLGGTEYPIHDLPGARQR